MNHVTNIAIVFFVFLFTYTYADLISINSLQIHETNLLKITLIIAFAIQWIAFIPAFLLQTEKFYDLTGSLTYLSVCLFSLYATQTIENLSYGNLIVAGAIIIWALRLGSFLFKRIHNAGKDGRFDSIKTSFSQFLMTWTLQGMWVFICSSAALVAISSPTGVVVNNVFIVGLAVFIIGFAIEVIADNQKSKFRLDEKNRNIFINEGLWSRSRHPNYFGEIMLWTGITIMSIPSFVGLNFLALFSPVFTYLLLNHISGVRILEARGNEKWGNLAEYQEYKKQTPKLIPKIFS